MKSRAVFLITMSCFLLVSFDSMSQSINEPMFLKVSRHLNRYNDELEKQLFRPLEVYTMCIMGGRTKTDTAKIALAQRGSSAVVVKKVKFIQIHGHIVYDYNYNSRVDTPFFQKEIHQHSIQTFLDITIKEQYPIRLQFTASFGNSNVFRDFTNINFQFNRADFVRRIQQKLKDQLVLTGFADSLNQIQERISITKVELGKVQSRLDATSSVQKQVEQAEMLLRSQTYSSNIKDTIYAGSMPRSGIVSEQWKVDSLRNQVEQLQTQYRSLKRKSENAIASYKSRLETVKTDRQLRQLLDSLGMSDTGLPKGYKFLMSLRSFGIGRNFVDYSELSIKNVSVNGINIEYNPGNYYAFAVGTVDYRYRDFIVGGPGQQRQYVVLARFGPGQKDGNHLYLTYYTGKKQFYNASVQTSGTNPNYHLSGVTVEWQQMLNKRIFLTAEVGKSSIPYYSNLSEGGSTKGLFDFKNRDNLAFSFKANSIIGRTGTKLLAAYRRTGSQFQSFSVFNNGANVSAWLTRVDQPLFKKRVVISASIRSNFFENPFVSQSFSSSTIFTSLQATIRIKRLPTISIGYYPSSQLVKLSESNYSENLFHTLNGSAFYLYRHGSTIMNTALVYTQFYNRSTDSNFVYFNAKNLMLSQTISVRKWVLCFNAMLSNSSGTRLVALEGNAQLRLNERLTAGSGIKYNSGNFYQGVKIGYSYTLTLQVPKIGGLQIMWDKGYLPGIQKQFVENNIGRLTFIKTF